MKLTNHERETLREYLGRLTEGFEFNGFCFDCDNEVALEAETDWAERTLADRIIDELDKAGFDLVKR